MKNKYPPDLTHARSVKTDKKEGRIQITAELSHTKTVTEIMEIMKISKRTLQRYMTDPLWHEHNGRPLTFAKRGRPTRTTLSPAEELQLIEAHLWHDDGHKWVEVAEIMQIPIRRLKYLLKKERAEKKRG